MSCYPKIQRRLRVGIKGRNIWRHLAEITDADMKARNADYEELKVKYLSNNVPDSEQAAVLGKLRSKGYATKWDPNSALFDKTGRRDFRNLISRLLLDIKKSLETLKSFLESSEAEWTAALDESNPKVKDFKAKAQQLIKDVHESIRSLALLLESFDYEVLATLKWIAKVFKLYRTTQEDKIAISNTSNKSPVPSKADSSSSSVPGSSSPHHSASSPIKAAQQQEPSMEIELSDSLDQGIEDDDAMDIDDIAARPKRGWADAALKWMNNLCLHVQALRSLTVSDRKETGQQRVTNYLTKVKLKVVGVTPEYRDTAMQSYESFMNEFEKNPNTRREIQEWLRSRSSMGDKAWNRSRFNGTWHCETILLSLHALSVYTTLVLCSLC